jgi:hypothetical protein
MKKVIYVFGLAALFTACQKEDGTAAANEPLSTSLVVEVSDAMDVNQEILDLVDQILITDKSTFKSASGSSVSAHGGYHEGHFDDDEYGTCVVVTDDQDNNLKTIDFGEGCTDRRGVVRSGQIVISYSDSSDVVGAFKEISFVNFYKDSINIQGARRIELTDIDSLGNKTTRMSLTGGKLVYPDGTYKTRDMEITTYKFRSSENRSENYTLISGFENGTGVDGVSFSMEITTPIKFVRNCEEYGRRKIPVEGVKVISTGDTDVVSIDFGDGTCDKLVDVTTNGVTETVDLATLYRGKEFERLKCRRKSHHHDD